MDTGKIKTMKDNNYPGVDGFPPRLFMETVEQVSIPFARVLHLSLNLSIKKEKKKREKFVLNGKKQTSYYYLNRVREISQTITDQ